MKFPSIIAITSLASMLAACTNQVPVKPVEKPTVTPSNVVNHGVPDATSATAGGAKCALQNGQQIGAFAKDGTFALGFGETGGLAAWSSPEGIRVKPISITGLPTGSGVSIPFPKETQPSEVVAVDRGFAVITKRVERTAGPCEANCGDKPCPEAKPGDANAQTCDKPTGYEYFVTLTDMDGKNPNAGRPFHTGLVDIETILLGDGRAFGILTKNEVVWIQKRPDGRLDADRVELPKVDYVVPVRGLGAPAILLVDNDGSMQLLDERGPHDIDGQWAGMQGKPGATPPAKNDAKPGAKPDAKPPAKPAGKPPVIASPAKPAVETIFQSHWGPKGRIEIARRSGDTTQYASLEKLVLHMLNDSESQEIRDSFTNSVALKLENGRLRRTGWDKRPLGEDVDVHAVDPVAIAARTRVAWSGTTFVFMHPTNPPHQQDVQAVGLVTATCRADKP